ncbi:MAG: DUF1841 family protein [Halothiobacillaceae bacterium]
MYGNDRNALRQRFIDAWEKGRSGRPLDPLETIIVDVVAMHPEYHALLDSGERALGRDWLPEDGETNPFLHLSMHVAVREMVLAGRPEGIGGEYKRLCDHFQDVMDAEHVIMEQLGEIMWQAQREGREPDQAAFMEAIGRIGR